MMTMPSTDHAIRCPSCGYDLRASVRDDGTASCSECGAYLDAVTVFFQRETGLVGSWKTMGRLTIPGGLLAFFGTLAVTMTPNASLAILLAGVSAITIIAAGIAGFAWYHQQERGESRIPRALESFTFGLIMVIWNIGVGVAGLGLFASILGALGLLQW